MSLRACDDLVILEAYIEEYLLRGDFVSRRRDVVRMLMRRGYRRRYIHAGIRRLFRDQHLLGSSSAGRPNNIAEQALLPGVIDRLKARAAEQNRARAPGSAASR